MILAYALSVLLDLHSSCLVINSKVGREVFSPFRTCRSQILYQSFATPAVILWWRKYNKEHPKVTKLVIIGGTVMHTGAMINNYRVYRKR